MPQLKDPLEFAATHHGGLHLAAIIDAPIAGISVAVGITTASASSVADMKGDHWCQLALQTQSSQAYACITGLREHDTWAYVSILCLTGTYIKYTHTTAELAVVYAILLFLKQDIVILCHRDKNSNTKTMAIALSSIQVLSKPKVWKKRHADVLIMLMR
jgi:hypothetical protein